MDNNTVIGERTRSDLNKIETLRDRDKVLEELWAQLD